MSSDREIRILAQRLANLEERVNARGRANQLRSSSIEDGAILEFDEAGQIMQVIGRQFDSTHGSIPVAGPPPPQPSGAGITLTSTPGGVVVRYNGTWADPGTVAPMDFSHFEVHVSEDPTVPAASFANLRGTINTARGGDVVVPWANTVPVYARVVARSLSGKASIPSDAAGPATPGTAPQIYTQAEMPAPLGPGDRGVWFDSDRGGLPHHWDGAAWTEAPFGSGAIGANSLVASDVLATGSVTAPLLAAVLVLASTIVGGNPSGYHATLSTDGLGLYAVDPNGAVVRVGGLGTGDDALTFIDPVTGDATFSVDRMGHAVTRSLSVEGEDTDGDGNITGGLQVYGRNFLDYIEDTAFGGTASALLLDAAGGIFASGISSPFGLGEVSFESIPGRQYLTIFDGMHFASSAGSIRALLTMRYTTGGVAPRIDNGVIVASKFFFIPTNGEAYSAPPVIRFGTYTTTPAEIRIGIQVQRFNGSAAGSTLTAYTYGSGEAFRAPFRFFNIDVGRDIPDTYVANDMGGTRESDGGGSAPTVPQPAPPSKKTYTSMWHANFTASYLGDGSRQSVNGDLYQGRTPYYAGGGNQKALAGFTGNARTGETGKTITQALSGATVNWVEVYLHCNHTHYNSGGMGRVGYHGNTSAPNTAPNSQYDGFGGATFRRGEARWLRLPAATHASWKNGTYRGITVGPGSNTDPLYYMRFTGGTTGGYRPAIRVNYTR